MTNPKKEETAYERNGYENREDYLNQTADEYGIDRFTLATMADILGESEDFDGLVSMLEDFGDMF